VFAGGIKRPPMRSAITVSLVPETKAGPFVFSEGLDDAFSKSKELGFDGVEIFPRSASELDVAAVSRLMDRHALRVAAVGTGAGWVVHKLMLTHSEPSVRRKARDFIKSIIEVAGQFAAPAIIGSMQGRWDGPVVREQALEYLGNALEELGKHASGYGVPLLYEPLNRYETNLFNRLGETTAWLRGRALPHVRILADLFHMNIEEANSAAALREAGALIGHVHFADSNRQAIGMGQTAVEPIVEALRAMNYAGYLSAEIFPLPDPLSAARQTISAFRKYTATG
jgi:sugar phosphate isomerase/epimerase